MWVEEPVSSLQLLLKLSPLTVNLTRVFANSLCVLARMMTAKFLHREIREKGGAYGGGARIGGGLFSFYSYRWVGGCTFTCVRPDANDS